MAERLDPESIEAIAARVAELLEDRTAAHRLVSAEELSRRLGISRATVYEKAEELGAIRLGTGPRARLRFDMALVAGRLGLDRVSGAMANGRPARARRGPKPRRAPRTGLLPIRGDSQR